MKTLTTTVKEVTGIQISMRDTILGISAIGFGLSFPHIFHVFELGSSFLPMYLPILILGLLSTPWVVIAVGLVTPLISYLISGMPPMNPPIALIMSFQLTLLGLSAYFLNQRLRWNFLAALIISILFERLITLFLASTLFGGIISISNVFNSYPGILVQFFGAAILYYLLKK